MDGSEDVQSNESAPTNITPMCQSPTECLIHMVNGNNKSPILKMSDEKWGVIRKAAEIRRQMKNYGTSRYRTIIENLPSVPDGHHGYHSKCYKNFSAVSDVHKFAPQSTPTPSVPKPQLRSVTPPQPSTSSGTAGIFPETCIICDRYSKKRPDGTKEYPTQIVTQQSEKIIHEVISILKLSNVMVKIAGVDLIAKEAKLHNSCRAEKIKAAERRTKKLETIHENIHDVDSADTDAFENICEYVQKSVIDNVRPEYLRSVFDRYITMYNDLDIEPFTSAQYMGKLLKKRFEKHLVFTSKSKKEGILIHASTLDYDSVKVVYDFKTSVEGQIIQTALQLRKALKNVEKQQMSDPLTIESLKNGEGDAPDLVKLFFRVLIGGSCTENHSESTMRRAEAASQDALFQVTNGRIKPPKHILTAMSLKSLTGSRKVLTMLNRFGHCINYHAVEELETELAYGIINRKVSCPAGAKKGKPAAVSFDNYDELTGTLSGKDTLHDTMGIFVQEVGNDSDEEIGSEVAPVRNQADPLTQPEVSVRTVGTKRKKQTRRRLTVEPANIPERRKKSRMSEFSYTNYDFRSILDRSGRARKLDLLWMTAKALEIENIPMWVGFNARYYEDHLPKQVVLYLPNLDRPPTDDAVVAETMRIAQRCAKECGQPYAVPSYDLDVAQRALKIIATDSGEYDDVFVLFGVFHILICLFRAIGRIVDESGGPAMLVDAGVLASGSMKGLIQCGNFNRCKRLHPILALSFQILNFRQFFETYDHRDAITVLLNRTVYDNAYSVESLIDSPIFDRFFDDYGKFVSDTLNGIHGQTAQFWMQYVENIHLYHILERSVRENDVDLFISTLTPVTDLFFGTNRTNYSRWMTKHQLDLMHMDETHPGLRQLLDAGLFSVRRTENQFSRLPNDLTLEQTVNADAASRKTGYSSATNNYNARLRWSVTRGARSALISALYEMAGMQKPSDVTADLTKYRMQRDLSDLLKVISTIEDCGDPNKLTTSALINIQTGKKADEGVAQSVLNVTSVGAGKHDAFVQECIDDPTRFQRPITRVKLKLFVKCGAKNRRTNHPIVSELRCTRDLFGRIAVLANQKGVDLEFLLTFPLTPVPLTLCKTDGSINHTNKSALFKLLDEKVQEHNAPTDIFSHVIDGNFLLHCLPPNLPATYGGLSRVILHQVLSYPSKRIDILFDTYEKPWVKDCEHERRGEEDGGDRYTISGHGQKRPAKIDEALKVTSFKQNLPRFLMTDWMEAHHALALGDRVLYLGVDDTCVKFHVVDDKVVREDILDLSSNHPEADTRICLHVQHCTQSDDAHGKDIVIRGTDTDILVASVHHVHKWEDVLLWMEVGTSGKDTRRYVNVNKIAAAIGRVMCEALPGFHAFTGCDYTPAFARKGKLRPFKLLERDERFMNAFADLTNGLPNDNTVSVVFEYVSLMYGAKKATQLNKYRFTVFEKAFGPRDVNKPLENIKGIDATGIPPCEAVVRQQIYRANYVAEMYHASCNNIIPKVPKRGWELHDENYRFVWFNSPQIPDQAIPDVIDDDDEDDDGERIYSRVLIDDDDAFGEDDYEPGD